MTPLTCPMASISPQATGRSTATGKPPRSVSTSAGRTTVSAPPPSSCDSSIPPPVISTSMGPPDYQWQSYRAQPQPAISSGSTFEPGLLPSPFPSGPRPHGGGATEPGLTRYNTHLSLCLLPRITACLICRNNWRSVELLNMITVIPGNRVSAGTRVSGISAPHQRGRSPRPAGAAGILAAVGLVAAGALLCLFLSAAVTGILAPAQAETVVPMIFPLEEKVEWTDTYGAPRGGGRSHQGNDIMVPKMTPLLAVADGEVDWLNREEEPSSYNGQPYYNLLLRGDDGNVYFYIHMNNDTPGTDDGQGGPENAYAPGLVEGSHVEAGQLLGWAGDSGNAEDVGSHLHFEIHIGGYGNTISPYASLMAAPTVGETVGETSAPTGVGSTPAGGKDSTSGPTAEPAPAAAPSSSPDSALPDFTDVSPSSWFYEDLVLLYGLDVVSGTTAHTFSPYGEVTRAHFTAFMVRAFAPEALGRAPSMQPVFQDVTQEHAAYTEINAAARAGLVKGVGDGSTFDPDSLINRAQMAVMLCRALGVSREGDSTGAEEGVSGDAGSFRDIPLGYWAAADIRTAYSLGLIQGGSDGRFRPEETSKRAHAVAVVARALRLQ